MLNGDAGALCSECLVRDFPKERGIATDVAVIPQADRDGAMIDAQDKGRLFDAVVDKQNPFIGLEGVDLRALKKA